MNRFLKPTAALIALSLLGACTNLRSYPDPTFRQATAAQLTPVTPPVPVRVEVQFQQMGKVKESSAIRLRGFVEQALMGSGVFVPNQQSSNVFKMVVNNVGDMGEARAAGIKNGLSFGLAGSMIADEYQCNTSYTGPDGAKKDVFSRHIMRTAVGRAELPLGVTGTDPGVAYGKIVEDAVYAAILQLQASQNLSAR